LTSESDKLDEAILKVTNSTGELNKTLSYTKTGNEALAIFNNNWSKFKDNLGSLLLPAANGILGTANDFIANNPFTSIFQTDEDRATLGRNSANRAFQKNFGIAQNEARGILGRFSGLNQRDQISASMDEIREKLGEMGVNVSPQAAVAMEAELQRLAGDMKKGPSGAAPSDKSGDLSTTADKAMSEHRQVRNVTINIDNLLQMLNTTVGSQQELSDLTGEPMLNALIKVVRDGEQALNTY